MDFTYYFFRSCDTFKTYHASNVDDILDEFMAFKHFVPVAGSIILDQSNQRCLLVKGWKGGSWSFPRGKREDPEEEDHICAIRESMEEVGYDISPLLNVNDFSEHSERKKRVVLYIIKGVNENYPFEPRTKKEVSEIVWHPLPIMKKRPNRYFMVGPFLDKLENWIKRNYTPSSTTPLSETSEICIIWKVDKEQNNWTPRTFSAKPGARIDTPSSFQMGPSTPCREVQNSIPNSAQKRPSTPRWSKSNLNEKRSSSHCWNSQIKSPHPSSSPCSNRSPYPKTNSCYSSTSPYPLRSPSASTYSNNSPYIPFKYRSPYHRRMEASDVFLWKK
ncbi:hypothetical protein SUGI_0436980 [Cryptomeria japonica]|uniref:mRNA-decapping enzyme subunit 2-like n=1 Tax=Cryptomeria japonica TaxID=3369 RepID=UPI002408B519|nr:mRNA-decapping enzyme subunit 2-like [Cryptomeria japonica]GLJ23153.1 hypothetical protein SUGI_0436980 [Cryptomeria japonica]